ncbi:OmpA family protein [Francisella sp. 19X1-34]|uniref:OmpA family protein n=1 Tax=Francisella sp. 19X1-34 TaxID=3087177 RepID=UPI002E36BDE1|nr:OmpA family protein [Francisella sp. 19X1-34]MED7787748.1 OmpA family protein [Francisella sp. 19X1-34]
MKKLLCIVLLAIFASLVTSCDTMGKKDNKPLSFPTLKYCTSEMLKSDKSFICIQRQKGPDLIETNIKFDTDSFTLNNQAKAVLNKLFAYLKLTNTTRFTIKGYAGKIDSNLISDKNLLTEHNIRLSKNRAISVREYLVKKGLEPDEGIEPADGIKIEALGYQDPIAPNDSSANRALNQRVEISIESKLVEQIDNIEHNLKHLRPADYTNFFSNVYLLNDNQLKDTAEIYDSREKRPVLGPNFTIFANKQYTAKQDNSNFIIVSKPKLIANFNDDQKVYKLGTAIYKFTFNGITALQTKNMSREASVGDYVIPNDIVSEKLPDKTFRVEDKITANVMEDVLNTNTFSSSYNSAVLNKGSSDGLKLGTEMILYEPATRVDGFPVPPKYIGYGFVYRQSDHYSIMLVVNSLQEITNDTMATTTL